MPGVACDEKAYPLARLAEAVDQRLSLQQFRRPRSVSIEPRETEIASDCQIELGRTRASPSRQNPRGLGLLSSVYDPPGTRPIDPSGAVPSPGALPLLCRRRSQARTSIRMCLASLDFLGFGLPPGSPSLGELVSQGKNNLQAPWLGITAFVVLGELLTLLVFIGEAVRDAFDLRKAPRIGRPR